jgi:hypothetical protein
MSDSSLQSGPKRTLIKSRGASLFAAGRERALDANMIEGLDFGQVAGQAGRSHPRCAAAGAIALAVSADAGAGLAGARAVAVIG